MNCMITLDTSKFSPTGYVEKIYIKLVPFPKTFLKSVVFPIYLHRTQSHKFCYTVTPLFFHVFTPL